MSRSKLKQGNDFFSSGDYVLAINAYNAFLEKNSDAEIKRAVSFNVYNAFKKISQNERKIFFPDSKKLLAEKAVQFRKEARYWECSLYWSAFIQKENVSDKEFKKVVDNVDELINCEAFDEAWYVISSIENLKPDDKSYLQKKGRCLLRHGKYAQAHVTWSKYWSLAENRVGFRDERVRKIENKKIKNNELFSIVKPNGTHDLNKQRPSICFYTALFGGYDQLPDLLYKPEGVDFICFTDRHIKANGWDVRVVDCTEDNPIIENRKYKILPHVHLSMYDYTCYVDSNIMFVGRVETLLDTWLLGNDFVAWGHPDRTDIYSEIEAILSSLRHPPNGLIEQYQWFHDEQVPSDIGLIEACFLWRKTSSTSVQNLMEKWWSVLISGKVNRDQPPLAYLMWKENVRPLLLPESLGNTRENEFFFKVPHVKHPVSGSLYENKVEKTLNNNSKLVWVYREEAKKIASTVMRGEQLSKIVSDKTNVNVDYVNESSLNEINNSLVILTKGFLKKISHIELEVLKANDNVICTDYVDDPEKKEVVEAVDVLVASSIRQLMHYKKTYPEKHSHMITHHVDPDIPYIDPPIDVARIGYFGELANARWQDELKDKVSFVLTNTKTRSREWVNELVHYNVHYAVRQKRSIDGFKPFLKGFTAAHCNAAIVVEKSEGDALYYLGSDYPYMVASSELEDVMEKLEYVEKYFLDFNWLIVKNRMQDLKVRSGFDNVSKEVINLLSIWRD